MAMILPSADRGDRQAATPFALEARPGTGHGDGVLDLLARCSSLEQVDVPAGETLIELGGTTGTIYFLISGRVEISKKEVVIATVGEPGAVFGEVSVLLGRPAIATVRTLEPCRFYVSRGGREFLASQPEIALFVSEVLARRLQMLINYLVDLKSQFQDRMDHLGMVDEVIETLIHQQIKR
jgi:CRP-like cAMP-binding protein